MEFRRCGIRKELPGPQATTLRAAKNEDTQLKHRHGLNKRHKSWPRKHESLKVSVCQRTRLDELRISCSLERAPGQEPRSLFAVVWGDLKKFPGCPFLPSKFEVVDAVSDGAALVSVWLRERGDPAFAYRLFRAYRDAPGFSPALALGIHAVGLSGCMALSLAGRGSPSGGPPRGGRTATHGPGGCGPSSRGWARRRHAPLPTGSLPGPRRKPLLPRPPPRTPSPAAPLPRAADLRTPPPPASAPPDGRPTDPPRDPSPGTRARPPRRRRRGKTRVPGTTRRSSCTGPGSSGRGSRSFSGRRAPSRPRARRRWRAPCSPAPCS